MHSFCLSASPLQHTLRKASQPAKQLLFRALTTRCRSISADPEHDYLSCNHQIVRDTEESLDQVDSDLLARLRQDGSLSNPYFLNKVVSFCAKYEFFYLGGQVHSTVFKMGFASNVFISSAFVDMYAKSGRMMDAQKLFDEMPETNVVTWNSLISGYLDNNFPEIAVALFVDMLRVAISVTTSSVLTCLVSCSRLEDRDLGVQVHGRSLKAGFSYDLVVGTGLINMYSKFSDAEHSSRVFDRMTEKNVVTWTSMVTAYAQNGKPDEAMVLVREMRRLGSRANCITYNSLLSSFSGPLYLDHCKQVHCCIIQQGLESNVYIAVTLVKVYSKCSNSLEDFKKVCSGVTQWDQISWNAVVAGYSNLGCGEEALKCFSQMRQAGIEIDFYTLTSVLGAAAYVEEGNVVHALVLKTGYGSSMYVQNGLLSMYARCGTFNDSKRVFWSMEKHDVVSWNAILTGCAHHGYGREAVELFEEMRKTDIEPDGTTFLAVLSACSHVGFVHNGLEYFELMKIHLSLESLQAEHYACLVDIFSRAGFLNEAEAFINSMPMKPGPSVFKALLGACIAHGNREMAARCAKQLLECWPDDPRTYVLVSKMLTMGGYWDDAADMHEIMRDKGMKKQRGCSWI